MWRTKVVHPKAATVNEIIEFVVERFAAKSSYPSGEKNRLAIALIDGFQNCFPVPI
jgi:hypothetical protein